MQRFEMLDFDGDGTWGEQSSVAALLRKWTDHVSWGAESDETWSNAFSICALSILDIRTESGHVLTRKIENS